MAHKFERCRMEPQKDGSVNIGITISDDRDESLGKSAQWVVCSVAHAHGWTTCDITALFSVGAKAALIVWLQGRRAEKALNIPKEIPLPTRKVQKDGKEVDEEIKDINL